MCYSPIPPPSHPSNSVQEKAKAFVDSDGSKETTFASQIFSDTHTDTVTQERHRHTDTDTDTQTHTESYCGQANINVKYVLREKD